MDKMKRIFSLLLFCMILGTLSQSVYAEHLPFSTEDTEIVFLLDTSNSMNSQDSDRMAIDGILQMAHSIPSNYKAGLVAYNTQIQAIVELNQHAGKLAEELEEIKYTGYTNAGEALSEGIELFSNNENTRRIIVMVSDGEIIMDNDENTKTSREQFARASQSAKERGIQIHIIALGNAFEKNSSKNKEQVHIFDAAERTDGTIYWQGQGGSITEIAEKILFDKCNFPKRNVGTVKGEKGSFHIDLPGREISKARVLLYGGSELLSVNANYSAEQGAVTNGKNFAVIDIEKPDTKEIEITFEAKDETTVNAYLIIEFDADIAADMTYRLEEQIINPEENKKKQEILYKHYVDLEFWMESGTTGGNVWDDPYFEGTTIPYSINGTEEEGKITDGRIRYSMQVDGVDSVEALFDLDSLSENYFGSLSLSNIVEIPPDPIIEPEPDYRPLFVILVVLALILLILIYLFVKKKRANMIYIAQPTSAERTKKVETKSYEYTGKLNMYVVQTINGRDVPPQMFRLFGRKSGRMTLEWVLNACKIKLGKIGEEDIIFYPGPDKTIIVMDQSENCTVMRGTEILKKGMGYPVFFDEKLTITFDDGITEIEVHYKKLKPSEY